jgi:3-phosphoshikimate 1-carboxyvinyltransferase
MSIFEIIPLKKPVKKEINLSGSKSITNRALIIASLTSGVSYLYNYSLSEDSQILIKILKASGIEIEKKEDYLKVKGGVDKFLNVFDKTFNVKMAGTTMRFLTGLFSLIKSRVVLDGEPRMRERPIFDLVLALKSLGVKITYLKKEGFPPIKIEGGIINKNEVLISGKISSQFISSLLMIGPLIKGGLLIKIKDKLVSSAFVDLTILVMKDFGIEVKVNKEKSQYFVPQSFYQPRSYFIEPDAASAGYFFGISALTKSCLSVNLSSFSQPDSQLINVFKKMGCKVKKGKKKMTVCGGEKLKAVNVCLENFPDSSLTLAVIASTIPSVTKITGLSTLKVKESDRLLALKNELEKIGIKSEISADSITIFGGKPHGAEIETYNDHRMALSFAILGTKIAGIKIKNPDVVKKSFPDFWEKLKSLGVFIKEL